MENFRLTIYRIISSFTPSCIIKKKKSLPSPAPIFSIKPSETSPPLFPLL